MRHLITTASIALLCIAAPQSSVAGPFADELTKCLVTSTTTEDRKGLVKWMFAAMASHPEVRSLSTVTSEQGSQFVVTTANLFERLLIQSCRSEAKTALEIEGRGVLKESFGVLGQVAASDLFAHPEVSAFSARLDQHIDLDELNAAIGVK